jgi:hypothetical protein
MVRFGTNLSMPSRLPVSSELRFGGSGGLVFIEEAAAMDVVGRLVFGGEDSEAAVKPWRSALSDERCLPDSVRGPVECRELRRFPPFARLMAARRDRLRLLIVGRRWRDGGA